MPQQPNTNRNLGGFQQQYHTFVTAQGCHLFRCLPQKAVASLRHFEVVALVEDYTPGLSGGGGGGRGFEGGAGGDPLKRQGFWYLAVTDEDFYMVERMGKDPRWVCVPLRHITDVRTQEHTGLLNSDQLNQGSLMIIVEEDDWRAGERAREVPPPEAARAGGGSFFQRLGLGKRAGHAEGGATAGPLGPLIIVTLGAASNLFFHMQRAWMGSRMKDVTREAFKTEAEAVPYSHQSRRTSFAGGRRRMSASFRPPDASWKAGFGGNALPGGSGGGGSGAGSSRDGGVAGGGATAKINRSQSIHFKGSSSSTAAWINRDSVVVTREVFRDLEHTILNSWCTLWEDEDVEAIEELTEYTDHASLIRELFFGQPEMLVYFTRSFGILSQLSNMRDPHAPQQPGSDADRRAARESWVGGWEASEEATASGGGWGRSPAAAGAWASPGGAVGGTPAGGRARAQAVEARRVDMWGSLVFSMRRRQAWNKALVFMEWLAKMLEHSEGVRERLQWARHRSGDRLSLEHVVTSLVELEPPRAPEVVRRSAMAKRVWGLDYRHGHNVYQPDYDDDFLDNLASILYDLDGLVEQACNVDPSFDSHFIASVIGGLSPERREAHVRPKLRSMFLRLMNLMLAPRRAMDGLRAFRMAHSLVLVLRGIPRAAYFLRDEFEEELRYVLQDPKIYRELGAQVGRESSKFFLDRCRVLTAEVIATCLETMPVARQELYARLLRSGEALPSSSDAELEDDPETPLQRVVGSGHGKALEQWPW